MRWRKADPGTSLVQVGRALGWRVKQRGRKDRLFRDRFRGFHDGNDYLYHTCPIQASDAKAGREPLPVMPLWFEADTGERSREGAVKLAPSSHIGVTVLSEQATVHACLRDCRALRAPAVSLNRNLLILFIRCSTSAIGQKSSLPDNPRRPQSFDLKGECSLHF
jgi:hypothetical protein